MTESFVPGVRMPEAPSPEAYVFAFRGRRLLVHLDDDRARVPSLGELETAAGDETLRLAPVRRQYLGSQEGRQVVSWELAEEADSPPGMAFKGLRGLFLMLEEDHIWLAGRAIQIVDWERDHQFCGRCATPTEDQDGERSKRCPHCGLTFYPRLSPAVIVLVERDDEILLARSPQFLPGMYSTLAGFVEPGENLEDAVAREIAEEVGVKVRRVRYFGSQPWPFPNSLMIGFRADYAGGEIVVDGSEIEDAGWFGPGNLPRIPPRISIARALIEAFLKERGPESSDS